MLRIGPVEVHPQGGLVRVSARTVQLSVREFALLVELARQAGRIVSRDELYATVWGAPLRPGDRSVDVYVHKLRAKLEREADGWLFIHTHIGFGYRFAPEPRPGAMGSVALRPVPSDPGR